jgi:hypothetical protein
MKSKIFILLILATMVNSTFAQEPLDYCPSYVDIVGTVEDECGDPVDGIYIYTDMVGQTISVRGEYMMNDVSAYSYFITARGNSIYMTEHGSISNPNCSSYLREDFVMNFTNDDWDADGVHNCDDKCPEVPNGPKLGTCVCGSMRGRTCKAQTGLDGCGCAGNFCCDNNQSDWDHDGIGISCSACITKVGGCVYPNEDARPAATTINDRYEPNTISGLHYELMIVGGQLDKVVVP